ncbi:hypothetical protein ACQ4PT_014963 [Festuca glaucescens]
MEEAVSFFFRECQNIKENSEAYQSARVAMEFMAIPSPSVSPNPAFKISVQGKQGSSAGGLPKAAILEPSVFVLEEFNAEEWIKVERKMRSKVLGRLSMPVPRYRRQTPVSSDRASQGGSRGYDPAGFGGDFGNFNEGYSDGGQGYGQNFNGNVYGGSQRAQCQYRNPGQGGRGRGGRGGRGRFNGRGTGGRVPPVQSGQEVVGANTEQLALAVTPQFQQVAHAVATMQPAVTTQALQQVLQGIQHQNITQGVTAGNEVDTVNNESVKGAKKKDKLADIICFKCEDSGHYAVDMEFTRAGEVVRLLVQVLNLDLILDETDHYFDGEGFKILIEVEGHAPQQYTDQEMDDADLDPDDKSNLGKDAENDNDHLGKKHKNNGHVDLPPNPTVPPQNVMNNLVSQLMDIPFGSFRWEQYGADWKMDKENTVGCLSAPLPCVNDGTIKVPEKSLSAIRTRDFVPKKLWGDYSESDDVLPSPLARVVSPSWNNSTSSDGLVVNDPAATKQFSAPEHKKMSANVLQAHAKIPLESALSSISAEVEMGAAETEFSLAVCTRHEVIVLTPVLHADEPRQEAMVGLPGVISCSPSWKEMSVVSPHTLGGDGGSRPRLLCQGDMVECVERECTLEVGTPRRRSSRLEAFQNRWLLVCGRAIRSELNPSLMQHSWRELNRCYLQNLQVHL